MASTALEPTRELGDVPLDIKGKVRTGLHPGVVRTVQVLTDLRR